MRWMGCFAKVAAKPETEPDTEVICASDSGSGLSVPPRGAAIRPAAPLAPLDCVWRGEEHNQVITILSDPVDTLRPP